MFDFMRVPRSFLEFIPRGLYEMMLGQRAVKAVVVRAREAVEKSLETHAAATIGRGNADEMKRTGKLRFEVLEE